MTQLKTVLISGALGIFMATGFQAVAHQTSAGHKMDDQKGMMGMDAGATALRQVMMESVKKMMAESKPMALHTDKAFALLMAEHHQSAVKMADIELKEGKNPRLRAMARQMKSAQLKEIKELRGIAAHLK